MSGQRTNTQSAGAGQDRDAGDRREQRSARRTSFSHRDDRRAARAVADDDEAGPPVGLPADEVRAPGRLVDPAGRRRRSPPPRGTRPGTRFGLGGARAGHAVTCRHGSSAGVGPQAEPQRLQRRGLVAGRCWPGSLRGPSRRMNQACWSLRGASKKSRSGARARATAVDDPRARCRRVRYRPTVPLSRPSAITHVAPASRSPATSPRPLVRGDVTPAGPCSRPRRARRSAGGARRSGRASSATGMGATPRDTSTLSNPPRRPVQALALPCPGAQAISSSVPPEAGPDAGRREQRQLGRQAADRGRRCPSRTSRCRCSAAARLQDGLGGCHDWHPCRARASARWTGACVDAPAG